MKTHRFIAALVMLIITLSSISNAAYPYRYYSKNNEHYINEGISLLYNTEVFEFPFGSEANPNDLNVGWMESENGWMTKKNNPNEKGEYKYLGYQYYRRLER